MYKTQIDGKTVYVYTEQEHLRALEYENISYKAKKLIELMGGDNNG